jgi:hypothetical protein
VEGEEVVFELVVDSDGATTEVVEVEERVVLTREEVVLLDDGGI